MKSGLAKAERILNKIDGIGFIKLDESDVVRHRLVKLIIRAYENAQAQEEQQEEDLKELRRKQRNENRGE
jgi:phosphate starvation-inducible PhoH-like protein